MSIRTRLLVLVLSALLVPGVLAVVNFMMDRSAAVTQAQSQLIQSAQAIAADLEEKIQGTAQLHFGLARARDLDTGDRGACSMFLSQVRETYPRFTGIITIEPDGDLFCDSLMTGRTLNLLDRRYFSQAVARPGGVAVEAVFGRLTGLPVLQIAHPARDATGALRFVLLASLNLNLAVEAHRGRFPDAEILLLDARGTVLVWSPDPAPDGSAGRSIADTALGRFAQKPESRVAEIADPDGRGAYFWGQAGLAAYPESGLRILVGMPRDALVAPANAGLVEGLATVAALALMLMGGVWLAADRGLREPVARIVAMATRLGAGDLTARLPPPHPSGEMGTLMRVLNGAAQSLEQQRATIDDLNTRLRHSQKMEAIGQLTGGIAHDFNNLLTVILGNSELLADAFARDPKALHLVEVTAQAAERGAELTGRLLAYARRQPLDPRAVDVNKKIVNMDGLLRRALGETIEVELVRGAGLWRANIDPGQLESAILNLALNARDAMRGGGRLTLETANVHLDDAYARTQAEVEPGQYVMVAVSDTGTGMTAEVLERATEPFFTTKPVGQGSGLGLSMVFGFVKQSRGHMRIYSEPGQGTTVRLYLPRAEAGAEATGVAADRPQALPPASDSPARILLVEDDPMVRDHVAALLVSLGYDVTAAETGVAALAHLQAGRFDLLFTDVVMPGGMSGRDLAEAARAIDPSLPILFTSGYTENAIVHHGRLDRGIQLLAKPYRRSELSQKLRAALSRGPRD